MKLLVLILASDGSPEYMKFQELWRKYTKSHPNIDCLFYKGNPKMEKTAELVDDTVYVKIEDTLDNVYDKLMMTLSFLYPRIDQYTFILRTNLSSFIDFNKYYHFCLLLPTRNICAAVISSHDDILFPSGAGFTISIDLAKRLVDENPPKVYLDDVSVGSAFNSWGVHYIEVNRVDYRGGEEWAYQHQFNPNEIIFHYRAKTGNRDNDYRALLKIYTKPFEWFT